MPLDFIHYPVSHSLLSVLVWGLLFASVYWTIRRYRAGTVVVAAAVISHWVLDLVVHRADLPLLPVGGVKVGLGLWSSLSGTLAVELVVFAVGLLLYLHRTTARNRWGTLGVWLLVSLLLAIYAASLFGPPPPNATANALAGHAQRPLVLIAYWLDSERQPAERLRVEG